MVRELEELGYLWAWRLVDCYGFGLPQRRERVFLIASRVEDPADVLLTDDSPMDRRATAFGERAHGFYWTEGSTGLGWAADSVPALKSGSGIGIPSPPAVVRINGQIVKPDIRDAERLQGFSIDWTEPAKEVGRASLRWRLVGNAVSVPVAEWIGRRLKRPGVYDLGRDREFDVDAPLPRAARFDGGTHWSVEISRDPLGIEPEPLEQFLEFEGTPLSTRATAGFLGRARDSSLRFPADFLNLVEAHLEIVAADDRLLLR